MFEIILRKLTIWRNETAKREGVDAFRVLPNKTLEELARVSPKDKNEMTAIKGIKEAKFAKYGRELIRIINGTENVTGINNSEGDLNYFRRTSFQNKVAETGSERERIFSVGEFLDILNNKLSSAGAKIRGEISSVEERERVVYFSIKDKKDESVINCLIFRYQYEISGVRLEEGMEVVAEGVPEIYKPSGRLSLKVSIIELEGEGALKKEYEKLKRKLEKEGFFAEEGKKKIVGLPQRIGLITSRDGAAIGDFTSNVGKYGLKIRFINSSVEGKRAIFELIKAVKSFKKVEIDTLVIIRGGGSLESLQAFNSEALIREVKKISVPVICGVGHDRDISLLSLASDYAVSTPTAAAKLISSLWEDKIGRINDYERNIIGNFESRVENVDWQIRNNATNIERGFRQVLRDAESRFDDFMLHNLRSVETTILDRERKIKEVKEMLIKKFEDIIYRLQNDIEKVDNIIKLNSPERQLRLGYGIVSKGGVCVKSVNDIQKGDFVRIRFFDGEADSRIEKIKKIKE